MAIPKKLSEKGKTLWNALRLTKDAWQNVFTGFGTDRDKTTYGSFAFGALLSFEELQGLYHQDDTAKKIVAFRPQEMLRQGIVLSVEDQPELGKQLVDTLIDFDALRRIRDAMIWGRLYGGAALLIGADDGLPVNEPLDETKIQTIRYLRIVTRRYLTPNLVLQDMLSENFTGEVQVYTVTPVQGGAPIDVHRSRMLLFGGAHTDEDIRANNGGWDCSVLQAPYDVLRDYQSVWKAGALLMSEASQSVFKLSGLLDMIAGGQKDILAERMTLVDMSRSVARAIMIDPEAGEAFERSTSSFTDAQQMLDRFMLRMASAAEMPVSLLMGREPAGMNATGESDFRYFYDTVRTAQQNDLYPELRRLIRIFMLAKDGPTHGVEPESWALTFPPLWQMTPKEQAELEKMHAEKDAIYINSDVIQPEDVATSRFKPEGFCTTLTIEQEPLPDVDESDPELMPDYAKPDTGTDTGTDTEAIGGIVLAPTDMAWLWSVNEARKAQGGGPLTLPDGSPDPDGRLTVGAYRAKCEAALEVVGTATGKVEAKAIDPKGSTETPPPAPPFLTTGGGANAPAPPPAGAPPPASAPASTGNVEPNGKLDAWRQDPFPNEHAARQTEPGDYVRFARKHPEGWPEGLDAVYGVTEDKKTEIQTIRADKAKWSVADFKAWLAKHGFKTTIEPATDAK